MLLSIRSLSLTTPLIVEWTIILEVDGIYTPLVSSTGCITATPKWDDTASINTYYGSMYFSFRVTSDSAYVFDMFSSVSSIASVSTNPFKLY